MSDAIDNNIIRNSHPKNVATYLGNRLDTIGSKTISEHLIASVACDAISPRVFRIWLSLCASPLALAQALQQDVSIVVRRYAMKVFGKRLRNVRFMQTWRALGGTEGMLELFSTLSVAEVSYFCKQIGSCYSAPIYVDSIWELITEFTRSLAFKHFPDAKYQHQDRRPLLKYYINLLPACTTNFLEEWITLFGFPDPASKKVLASHWRYLQRSLMHNTHGYDYKDSLWLKPLFRSVPDRPTDGGQLSRSMEYTIDSLRSAVDDKSGISAYLDFFTDIAEPLLRRVERSKASPEVRCRAMDLISAYMISNPKEICDFKFVDSPLLLRYAVKIWSRNPEAHSAGLGKLLKAFPKEARDPPEYSTYGQPELLDVLTIARPTQRYHLLRLICRHVKSMDLDLDNDTDIKLSDKSMWGEKAFKYLPKSDRLRLLDRFMRIRPSCDFFCVPSCDGLLLELRQGADGHRGLATKKLEEAKRSTVATRDQSNRAFQAKGAIYIAAASGYQDLLAETLLWTRRFIRDALTIKQLYNSVYIQNTDIIQSLCGFPKPDDTDATAQSVKRAVLKGNDMIKILYETMRMSQAEPSFTLRDWSTTQEILGKTIEMRISKVTALQRRLKLTDAETYSMVWESTLETWIELETMGLKEENGKLKLGTPRGLLELTEIGTCSPATLRFIDQVARRRDDLWHAHRRAVTPAVVDFREPWNKGLPIQSLHPFQRQGRTGTRERLITPYLFERATDIVFMSSEAAFRPMPEDDETKTAIRCMVDDFTTALNIYYVGMDDDRMARSVRAQEVWDYAMNNLTGDRMSHAQYFWRDIFENASIQTDKLTFQLPERPRPVLPKADDDKERIEWNPEPVRALRLKSQTLNRVALDSLLQIGVAGQTKPLLEEEFFKGTSRTPTINRVNFWDPEEGDSPAVVEALMASAMLYITSEKAPRSGLFVNPFPSRQDVRFPSIYLDDAFLQRSGVDIKPSDATHYLSKRLLDVPPALLAKLAHAALQPVFDKDFDRTPDFTPFVLLKLLSKSDRPSLAFGMIQQLVIERPTDSSWHRQFASASFFKRLSPTQANELLKGIADMIQARLKESAERAAEAKLAPQAKEVSSNGPIVKITTVKMLAQLMRKADFFDESASVSLLGNLFANSKHIDIRVAVAESLLAMLAETDDPELKERIFVELEQHAVPMAGRLDERSDPSEQDWANAEANNDISTLAWDYMGDAHPMMWLLIRTDIQQSDTQAKFDRLVVPAIEASTQKNMRYLAIILRKHAPHIPIESLPRTPVCMAYITELLETGISRQPSRPKSLEYLPGSFLRNYISYQNFLLSPPAHVSSFTNQIRRDTTRLQPSPEGTAWLLNYRDLRHPDTPNTSSQASPSLSTSPFFQTNKYLTANFSTKRSDGQGITPQELQQTAFTQLDLLLSLRGNTLPLWSSFLNSLERKPNHKAPEDSNWLAWAETVVARTVQSVSEIRKNPAWQRDPARKPATLPDVFRARVWLMDWPVLPADRAVAEDWEEQCQELAADILGLLEGLVAAEFGRAWNRQFEELVQSLNGKLHPLFRPTVVRLVGGDLRQLSEGGVDGGMPGLAREQERDRSELFEILRVRLAGRMLETRKPGRQWDIPEPEAVKGPLREMMLEWRRSGIEEVRMAGWEANGEWFVEGK